jgi:hypothetical protein
MCRFGNKGLEKAMEEREKDLVKLQTLLMTVWSSDPDVLKRMVEKEQEGQQKSDEKQGGGEDNALNEKGESESDNKRERRWWYGF